MPLAVEAELIQHEVDGLVARFWLNRPQKRNRVSQQLLGVIVGGIIQAPAHGE